MLDELGRGTSTTEGSALCAALLEWLDTRRIPAVFATHLHEIDSRLDALPPLTTLSRKCLPATTHPDGSVKMSFTLADGVCRDSLALHAARCAGLPADLMARAESLMKLEDDEGGEGVGGTAAARREGGGLPALDVDGGDLERAKATKAAKAAKAAEAEGMAAVDVSPAAAQLREETARQMLSTASQVLHELSGRKELVHINADWRPPPRLSGRSCVYLLQLAGEGSAGSLYVGESDAIERRLKEHRRSHASRKVECVLVEVESKTAALQLEELMIRRLKEMGVARVRNVAHS